MGTSTFWSVICHSFDKLDNEVLHTDIIYFILFTDKSNLENEKPDFAGETLQRNRVQKVLFQHTLILDNNFAHRSLMTHTTKMSMRTGPHRLFKSSTGYELFMLIQMV